MIEGMLHLQPLKRKRASDLDDNVKEINNEDEKNFDGITSINILY